jgi:ABC-2 type transport system ATP-binding protein
MDDLASSTASDGNEVPGSARAEEEPVTATLPPAPRLESITASSLRLTGLEKHYSGSPPVTALAGIDLEVAPGEMFGLLGPNGAGKSTTVGICTTRIRPTAGRVEVAGLDALRDPAGVKRRIGVVTQSNTLDRSLTLRENLELHGRYFGWGRRRSRDRADELLERFRLSERATAFPAQISGGMAQRLQVARAIAHEPSVLFLDEPTAGLDPQSRIALWELVGQLREDGITVVLTTHYMEEADQLCDRVAIIDHGRILVCDTPTALKEAHGAAAVVELHLDRPASEPMLEALRRLEVVRSVEPTVHGVRVMAADADGLLAKVVTATNGAGLSDISLTGSTLEAVFINLTGRDLRE